LALILSFNPYYLDSVKYLPVLDIPALYISLRD
jgi:hypothetical protein